LGIEKFIVLASAILHDTCSCAPVFSTGTIFAVYYIMDNRMTVGGYFSFLT